VLRLAFPDTGSDREADLAVDAYGALRTDGGVETLSVFALFADARPGVADLALDPAGAAAEKLGGWWAHALLPPETRLPRAPGSLLHRLRAHRASAATARRAQAWAEQALAWMLEADIVDRVDATATVAGGRLDLDITLYRGGAAVLRSAWANLT